MGISEEEPVAAEAVEQEWVSRFLASLEQGNVDHVARALLDGFKSIGKYQEKLHLEADHLNGENGIVIRSSDETLLGEAGDLSGFAHGNALLRHAGLNLAEASSGKWTGQMKISKRGRSRLRRFIFMMTMSLIANNPEFKAMHVYNVQVKKMKKMRSLMKLCGKLARILVGMARSNEAYNPQKTKPIQLVA